MGSDTGGSIRLPSHFNGIAGIKPNSGRVPRTGHAVPYGMGATDAYTQNGPMARYVEDLVAHAADHLRAGLGGSLQSCRCHLGDPADVDLGSLKVAFYTSSEGIQGSDTGDDRCRRVSAIKVVSDVVASVEEDTPEPLRRVTELTGRIGGGDGRAWTQRLLDKAGTTEKSPFLTGRASKMPRRFQQRSLHRRWRSLTSTGATCSDSSRATTP